MLRFLCAVSQLGVPPLRRGLQIGSGLGLPQLEAEANASALTMAARPEATLTVATWNVWFGRQHMEQRYSALLRTLLRRAPDVVGLQEVVPALADALRAHEAVSALYEVSPNAIGSYGCLLLARRALRPHIVEIDLPTDMGRTLLVAELAARPGVAVATVHLESLDSERVRGEQLAVAARALGGAAHAVLMGDFNFDATRTWGEWRDGGVARSPGALENDALPRLLPHFVDAWPVVRGAEPGFTFDGATNPYAHDPGERMRYDRVMAKGLRPEHIEMLGNGGEAQPVPSDHFGLFATLVPSAASPKARAQTPPHAPPAEPATAPSLLVHAATKTDEADGQPTAARGQPNTSRTPEARLAWLLVVILACAAGLLGGCCLSSCSDAERPCCGRGRATAREYHPHERENDV